VSVPELLAFHGRGEALAPNVRLGTPGKARTRRG
jgi:hypothetical protein